MPDWANNGLNAVAVILPALGFALLLNILMEKTLIPFFIAGFAITAFSGLRQHCLCTCLEPIKLPVSAVLMPEERRMKSYEQSGYQRKE
ncbi:PTS sugar transporter subunit IIC [Heyndrickxia coagulans]|uniref:PTS sugar transporter subunit IIC n=1 Tax=Heyndrickxia coagulans TaxID=1398 RepID=UPI00352F8B91